MDANLTDESLSEGSAVPLMHGLLEKVSLVYIFLPSLIFCIGWLKPYICVPVCAALSIGFYFSFKAKERISQKDNTLYFSASTLFLILCLILFVLLFSGIGGYAWQHGDYEKHNAFLRDLIENPWPLGYDNMGPEEKTYVVVTYIGYYLPPAVVGKILGWNVANHFTFIWSVLGVFLAVLWFLKLVGKASFFFALLFLFFGGLDIVGTALIHTWPPSATAVTSQRYIQYLDTWLFRSPVLKGFSWILPSFITLIYLGHHHILPNWIIILMIMYSAVHRRSARDILFLWALSPISSAFVFIGLTPYVLVSLYTTKLKGMMSFQNLVSAPVLLAVVGLFIASNNSEYPHGWIWQYHNLLEVWPVLFLFCGIEFGLHAAFCPKINQTDPYFPQRIWWWTAIVCLVLCTFYRLGTYCEFTSKTSIPSLLVFVVYLGATMKNAKTDKEKMCVHVLKILLVIGACAGLFSISKGITRKQFSLQPPAISTVKHIDHYINGYWKVGRQLLSDPDDSFFWRYLAKELEIP